MKIAFSRRYARRNSSGRSQIGSSSKMKGWGYACMLLVLLITACLNPASNEKELNKEKGNEKQKEPTEKLTISYTSKEFVFYEYTGFSSSPRITPVGAEVSFKVTSGELPFGLSLNKRTGVISGKGRFPVKENVTIMATGTSANVEGQTADAVISFEVKRLKPVTWLSYGLGLIDHLGFHASLKGTAGTPVNRKPTLTPADAKGIYSIRKGSYNSITPETFKSETGLDFSLTEGTISGTPTRNVDRIEYTIRFTGDKSQGFSGSASQIVPIHIYPAPFSVKYTGTKIYGGGTNTNISLTGKGTSTSEGYSMSLYYSTDLTKTDTDVDLGPVFTPPAAAEGATYSIQAVDMYGTEDTNPTFSITAATGLTFSPLTGKISGDTDKVSDHRYYRIRITPKDDSIYGGGSRDVFLRIRVSAPSIFS